MEFMMDYLSNELPEDSRAIFERHLTACPHCVRYLKTYQTTITLCREAFDVPPMRTVPAEIPEALVQAILAAQRQAVRQGAQVRLVR